jgi:organic radical activating enzyme
VDTLLAPVLEVFASYQGEGLFVGQPQTFLRLAGCPLRCRYCDTPHSWQVPGEEGHWLSPFGAMIEVAEVELDRTRPISVTGGEPLLWPGFLEALADVAGERALHLETAGHDLEALVRIGGFFSHISLDLKLPADLAAPVGIDQPASASDWDALRPAQLELLSQHAGSACVKLVVTPGTDPGAYERLLGDLERLAPTLPLFITPATPRKGSPLGPLDALDGVVAAALDLGLEPRVLTQLHRALGVR